VIGGEDVVRTLRRTLTADADEPVTTTSLARGLGVPMRDVVRALMSEGVMKAALDPLTDEEVALATSRLDRPPRSE
jgi:hypothetical protein